MMQWRECSRSMEIKSLKIGSLPSATKTNNLKQIKAISKIVSYNTCIIASSQVYSVASHCLANWGFFTDFWSILRHDKFARSDNKIRKIKSQKFQAALSACSVQCLLGLGIFSHNIQQPLVSLFPSIGD